MAIQRVLHPTLGFTLLMIGMMMGVTVHDSFGLLTILGGLMLGFSSIRNDLPCMNKKAKLLFYVTFIFFILLFSSAFLIVIKLTG